MGLTHHAVDGGDSGQCSNRKKKGKKGPFGKHKEGEKQKLWGWVKDEQVLEGGGCVVVRR